MMVNQLLQKDLELQQIIQNHRIKVDQPEIFSKQGLSAITVILNLFCLVAHLSDFLTPY